jgi:hypothetical protein
LLKEETMVIATCISLMPNFDPKDWPRKFVALPRPGELVISNDGTETLTVIKVKHSVKKGSPRSRNENVPYAEIILGR